MNPHDLLPWYVNRSLDPGDTVEFERHLSSCVECAQEIEVVEQLRARLRDEETHGDPFEHPEPSKLFAADAPDEPEQPLPPDEAVAVRRHLALCFACRQELEWIRGRAVAAGGASTMPTVALDRLRPALWAAVAAAVVLPLVTFYLARWTGPSEPRSGLTMLQLVPPAERASAPEIAVSIAPGADRLTLLLEVDLGPDDFPANLTLTTREGRRIISSLSVARDDLFREAYLTLTCQARDCPPGDYVATLRARGDAHPPAEYRFRVVAAQSATRPSP